MDDWKLLLHEYDAAIRDYEYMKHLGKLEVEERRFRLNELDRHFKLATDPYDSNIYLRLKDESCDELRSFLMRWLPRRLAYSDDERQMKTQEYSERKPPVQLSSFVDRLVKFLLALVGGASLIVPMLIMSFHASKTKSLVTVSIATFVFSFVLAMALRLKINDVLGATAAYAAVLVVFVGTST
ncbi:hypothetical protein N431DRAFT_445261 [Stipitochalara longipes BDJ]|nr:hypothetical protein N431DRAFT_445261 [Stipitochalara longipes BDJ]